MRNLLVRGFVRGISRAFLGFCVAVFVFTLVLSLSSTITYAQNEPGNEEEQPDMSLVSEENRENVIKNVLPYLGSGNVQQILAQELGVEIDGKSNDVKARAADMDALQEQLRALGRMGNSFMAQFDFSATDVPIGAHPTFHENEPSIAANPVDEQFVVAGSHRLGGGQPVRCLAYMSTDGGLTWSEPFVMPQLTAASTCSDPVLAYAPDGNRVYYAYMDIKTPANGGFDIVVNYSNDNGATWLPLPIIALDGSGLGPFAIQYDKPWIGTHTPIDGPQANNSFVYVTATAFRVSGVTDPPPPIPPISIAFTRSTNLGVTWATGGLVMDSVPDPAPGTVQQVVQGSRVTGGLGNEVLVAWYNSGPDGWLVGNFQIRTRRSANAGGQFDPIVQAATDSTEVPFFLGPQAVYYRWWITMGPDVEIDTSGVAHIIYTHDPVPGSTNGEDGDIRYISSSGSPYNSWTDPATISDDTSGQAQGYPALETVGTVPHVIYEDHRLASPPAFNVVYDIFYTRNDGGGWEPSSRVTSASSLAEFQFIGDYNDLTARPDGSLVGIWTDRRDKISLNDQEDDIWGAVITP